MADDSLQRLEGLQPGMRKLAEQAFEKAAAQNVDVFVVSALRTYEEQQRLYAQGRETAGSIVTNAKPGESYHNFGLAFDFAVVKNGRAVWDQNHPDWKAFVAIGKGLGLDWGGDWRTFKDYPHLQQGDAPTLASLRAKFAHGWRGESIPEWRVVTEPPLENGCRDKRPGDGKGIVARLQLMLLVDDDGYYGDVTEHALRVWQRRHDRTGATVAGRRGLRATGVVDERTWQALTAGAADVEDEGDLAEGAGWLPPHEIADAVGADPQSVLANWPRIQMALRRAGMDGDAVKIAAAATVVTEVGRGFAPINEFGDEDYFTRMYEGRADLGNTRPGDGARYHGRGYYRTFGNRLGLPLEERPHLALEPATAARILVDYFGERGVDEAARSGNWKLAREKVNGGLNGWPVFDAAVKSLKRLV
jgi:peptidoglycan hydrolase-like protein with peptidoglycan-binding domain